MRKSTVEVFLSESPIALRIPADARIVIRRFEASSRDVEAAVETGRVEIEAKPMCDLVVGGETLAHGEITTDGGASRFRVTGVVE
jgi:hypothetical protein